MDNMRHKPSPTLEVVECDDCYYLRFLVKYQDAFNKLMRRIIGFNATMYRISGTNTMEASFNKGAFVDAFMLQAYKANWCLKLRHNGQVFDDTFRVSQDIVDIINRKVKY